MSNRRQDGPEHKRADKKVAAQKSSEPKTGGTRALSPSEALEPTRAPSRPRGPRNREPSRAVSATVRVISGFLTLALVVMGAIGTFGLLVSHQFESAGPLEVTRTFAVPKGEGRIQIAQRLEREGMIASRWTFVAGHMLQGYLGGQKRNMELKAGEYEIKKGASMRQILDTLTEGKSVLAKLTIPEGLTSQQIVERVLAEPSLSGEVTQIPAEGTLLPDTYRFSKGMDRQELIERMQAEQQKFLAAVWEKRAKDLPVATIEDALTLASIVEKETGRADERERVAAVFVNRMRKRMRLQSDPTIIYGIVGGKGSLGRPITRADIDTPTPYNTYTIPGLPPGPICNPGRSAIEATLNPATTTDLYFVADGTGGHTFSDTLKEHNQAVQVWRKVEKEQRARQPEQPQAAGTRAVSRPAPPAGGAGADADAAPGQQDVPLPPSAAPPPGEAAVDPTTAAAAAPVKPLNAGAAAVPLPVRKPKVTSATK